MTTGRINQVTLLPEEKEWIALPKAEKRLNLFPPCDRL
jgi:hypothetical protein